LHSRQFNDYRPRPKIGWAACRSKFGRRAAHQTELEATGKEYLTSRCNCHGEKKKVHTLLPSISAPKSKKKNTKRKKAQGGEDPRKERQVLSRKETALLTGRLAPRRDQPAFLMLKGF